MEFEEARLHAGGMIWEHGGYSPDIWRRAMRVIPHYIWTIGDEKHRRGYCTACERWVDLDPGSLIPNWAANDPYLDTDADGYPFIPFQTMPEHVFQSRHSGRTRHLDTGYCPECGERVQFRGLYRGHKSLTDRRFLIVYRKDAMDPVNAVVCVGYELYVPWRNMDDYEPYVPMEITPRELCVFQHGKGGQRFVHEWEWGRGKWQERWKHRKECKSGFAPGAGPFSGGIQTVLDRESFLEAVQGTPFAPIVMGDAGNISVSNAWNYYDRITVMDRLARYPCTEYLYRLGFDELAVAVIDKDTDGLLNLRGKTAQKVLCLTPDQWAEVKGKHLPVTRDGLWLMQQTSKDKRLRMSMELCAEVGRWGRAEMEAVKKLLDQYREVNPVKALKYCQKRDVKVRDYVDYLRQMRELRMPYTDGMTTFPRDFDEMHARLSERLTARANSKNDKQIRERLEELSAYQFSAYGLILRPMISAAEVVAEGTKQHHCVGGYVSQYAGGNDVLCVLREESAPNTPLYTVEFGRDGHLIQCRGAYNRTRPEDEERLKRFWAPYKAIQPEMMAQTRRADEQKQTKERKTA